MSYIYPIPHSHPMKYKVYFVYKCQKIYLATSTSYKEADALLKEAEMIMTLPPGIPHFAPFKLNVQKIVCLCNLRDHQHYIKNPIYLYPTYFHYYLSATCVLTFDLKDLFYFSTYKIHQRGHYLYTQDSISQKSILSRFGIMNYSVIGKDYRFKNGNPYDFRQQNLEIINPYKGVTKKEKGGCIFYTASICLPKKLIIGHYTSEVEAAIAYNKALDLLARYEHPLTSSRNSIPFLTRTEYEAIYHRLSLSPRLLHLHHPRKRVISTKKYRGISKERNSYKTHIGYNRRQYYLGMYPTEKRAAQAYNYASFYLFGRSGYINEVTPLVEDRDIQKIAAFLNKYGLLKTPYASSSSEEIHNLTTPQS